MYRRISLLAGCFLFTMLLLTGLMSWLSPAARAQTASIITVDTVDDELNTDGDCSLREAVEAANTDAAVDACLAGSGDDIINIPSGTYTLTLHGADENANQTGDLDILDNLTINGDPSGGTVIDGDASDRVLHVQGVTLTVNDVQITNGYALFGGGIRNLNGNLNLYRCVVSNNSAGDGGGLLNQADVGGTATMVISGTQVLDNLADASISQYGYGGGIGNLAVDDSSSAVVTVTQSLIAGNMSVSDSENTLGGGIISLPTNCTTCKTRLYIEASILRENTSGWGGGIATGKWADAPLAQVNVTIDRSTLSENEATSGHGGGLMISAGTATLINSTFSSNVAGSRGGGLAVFGTYAPVTVNITSTSIVSNSANVFGGGLAQLLVNYAPETTFKNTIIAGNAAPVDAGCYKQAGTLTSLGHNLESGDTCGLDKPTDLPNTDPLLGPLQDNGGETWSHALLPLSPALDAGDDGACPPTDQRGVARPQDGDGDGAAVCDIGSFEAGMYHIFIPLVTQSQVITGLRGLSIAAPSLAVMLVACGIGAGWLKRGRD